MTICSGARNWIAIASAEHARRGRDHAPVGFMQVGHGKSAPLRRISPGDRVAYYAPATVYGGKDRLQSFVSIGIVQPGVPYPVEMSHGFVPWRRDVRYVSSQEAPIAPLIEAFDFVDDPKRWGAKFRFGLFPVSAHDLRLIADAMRADVVALGLEDLRTEHGSDPPVLASLEDRAPHGTHKPASCAALTACSRSCS